MKKLEKTRGSGLPARAVTVLAFLLFWSLSSLLFAQAGEVQFIFTSDAHYGIKRAAFHETPKVDAQTVNQFMILKMNALPELTFPKDGGINAGKPVGPIDFIVETGDISNRQEGDASSSIQSSQISWNQFKRDYIDGLKIMDRNNSKAPFFILPGNHDASNAIGHVKPLYPVTDATAMVEMYNALSAPTSLKTKETYQYAADRVHYSKNFSGIQFFFLHIWPDSLERAWLESELKKVNPDMPVILFAHDPPDVDAKHFINPNGDHGLNNTDKFENLLSDRFGSGTKITDPSTKEQAEFAKFLKTHPNITAYFHGHTNFNQFYDWVSPDGATVLRTFRVDSPMKGEISANDERKLSFQIVTINTKSRMMTVRECLWNTDPKNPEAPMVWGASVTMACFPRPIFNNN